MQRLSLFIFILILQVTTLLAASKIYDSANTRIESFFTKENTTYVLTHNHKSNKKVVVPKGCTIVFNGGAISAPITFTNTMLKGSINLKGSKLSGTISNKEFNAAWLCYKDGNQDDASNINNILSISNKVFFPSGIYRLKSFHTPLYKINKPYHIGIYRSGVMLRGETGSVLCTSEMAGTLCIYSKPKDIPGSIHDITIQKLSFKVESESTDFVKEQEHCHTISTMGVKNLSITNCTFHNFWGDAICLNHYGDNENTGERARNMNVVIKNNFIDGYKSCNRNGVSIINGQDVLVKSNHIINSSHGTMPGAIDIEPNNTAYTINRIIISNNVIDRCKGKNAAIGVISNRHKGPVHNVKINNNTITNSTRAFEFAVECDNVADNIVVTNNSSDANTDPYIFYGIGRTKNWVFTGNSFKRKATNKFGGRIKFINMKSSE
ncbi:MAG: hypothetical protein KBT29_06925 [Prevotellaceae bacterium]|nr:hypothetical protein [Candidatus Minthosoma caballi]